MNTTDVLLAKGILYLRLKEKYEYDGSGRILYHGVAPRGAATSDSIWIVEKTVYGPDGISDILISQDNVKWDDRAGASYS